MVEVIQRIQTVNKSIQDLNQQHNFYLETSLVSIYATPSTGLNFDEKLIKTFK